MKEEAVPCKNPSKHPQPLKADVYFAKLESIADTPTTCTPSLSGEKEKHAEKEEEKVKADNPRQVDIHKSETAERMIPKNEAQR